jgi:phosphate-selective porin
MTDNVKLMLWYDHVKNESTSLAGFTGDVDDDIFTARLQFRF